MTPIDEAYALVRLLYALESGYGDSTRLPAIAEAGGLLKLAVEQSQCRPGTMGARAAPMTAATGLQKLGALDWSNDIERLIELARARVIPVEKFAAPKKGDARR